MQEEVNNKTVALVVRASKLTASTLYWAMQHYIEHGKLKYGDYENEVGGNDPIKVITLKKVNADDGKGSNVVARNVTGKYVYENRKAFEFEVRL